MDYHIPYASIHVRTYLSWANAPLYRSPSYQSSHIRSHQEEEDYLVRIKPYQKQEE